MNGQVDYTKPLPYGTDLGRLNPACTAGRHGTYTAFRDGCRCPHARDAWRIYQKRHREGRAEPRRFDATGVRRRIQALWAIGHNSQAISAATGGRLSADNIHLITKRSAVVASTRDAIFDAYRRLSGKPGTSSTTRRRAVAAGFPSPMRWGADIDDPNAKPDPAGSPRKQPAVVDDVAVQRALEETGVELSTEEQTAALRLAVAKGEPLSRAAAHLGINYFGARKLLAGDLTPRRAQQQRVEAALTEMGHLTDSAIGALLGVHHQTVTRARARLARRQEQLAS
ncbi:hypothetical protein ACQP2Y_21830 [Actinoplanes sp. CA-051413]|uniref:hypothetical protein n=1 Tax=Actinoplanes sp. CA-051413 TaxID=3239899 RepID=UPI003D9774C8